MLLRSAGRHIEVPNLGRRRWTSSSALHWQLEEARMAGIAMSRMKASVLSILLVIAATFGYSALKRRPCSVSTATVTAPSTLARSVEMPSNPAPVDSAAMRLAALEALRPGDGLPSPTVATSPKHRSRVRRERTVAASDTFMVAKNAAESSTSEEARLLLEAHRQLALGEPAEALALLTEHERRFPTSSMRQEREAATIVANCNQGAQGDARQHWQAFVRQWPNSPFGERIRSACHWSAGP
jgi:hypothetical protein